MSENGKQPLEQRISDSLVMFADFIYAIVFGLIVSETYDKVIVNEDKPIWQKVQDMTLIVVMFYFLAWDWLRARLLTIKNPYKGYQRFFMEIVIAFFAYGIALEVMRGRTFFLVYVVGVLAVGVLWAIRTKYDYLESRDLIELRNIQQLQSIFAVIAGTAFLLFRLMSGPQINIFLILFMIIFVWDLVL